MIILAGWARIKDGSREGGLEHMRRFVAATRAEPGCLDFSIAFDLEDEHKLRVFEIYEDAAALDAHRSSEHFAAWRAAFGENVVEASFSQYDGAQRS